MKVYLERDDGYNEPTVYDYLSWDDVRENLIGSRPTMEDVLRYYSDRDDLTPERRERAEQTFRSEVRDWEDAIHRIRSMEAGEVFQLYWNCDTFTVVTAEVMEGRAAEALEMARKMREDL